MKIEGLFFAAILLVGVSAWPAERPPQHPELRRAINLGKYDQAREYIKRGAEEIYCGDMPADSAKAVWDKRWKKEPYHALRGCLRQYTSFYPEKACQSKWSSPEICAGRLKDSASLADPKRFYALASAALDDSEYKTRLKDEIAVLGEGRLMALADDAGFDFARDSVLPEDMNAWTGMLRDLQRKFKLFGNGEKDFYPGSEKWTVSPRLQASVEAHKAAKAAKAKADSAHAAIWERVARRGESRSQPEERTVHILKIVEVVDYTPTGRRIVVYSNGTPTTPQFTGKEMDAETGLYHFGARQYDPELALWAQIDPGRQFASPYAYAGNGVNPINGVDPDGEKYVGKAAEFYEQLQKDDFLGSPTLKKWWDAGAESSKTIDIFWKEGYDGATHDVYDDVELLVISKGTEKYPVKIEDRAVLGRHEIHHVLEPNLQPAGHLVPELRAAQHGGYRGFLKWNATLEGQKDYDPIYGEDEKVYVEIENARK